jgi:hypothetical protein
MAYTNPSIAASGITFAQALASGFAGHLLKLMAAQANTGNPSAAPAISQTGSAGTLPAGTYYAVVAETNGIGETAASAVSAGQAISGTQELLITPAAFQAGNVACNIYVGTSASGPFTLVAEGQPHAAFTLASLPTSTWSTAKAPTTNNTALTAVNAAGVTVNRKYDRLKRIQQAGDANQVVGDLAQLYRNFGAGTPIPYGEARQKLTDAHVVFVHLTTVCAELGALLDANPGHFSSVATGIGGTQTQRQFP